ncbi:MAG: HAD-IIIC family phosphatase [Amaricoccus sp.]|uniref:HAD-IIIC family phosphatase n=1 Tax=Amaricoccus sp. TaxID=1872485 RepID=UPI003314B8A4
MDWLPPARDFRARLAEAGADAEAGIAKLATLANANLSFLEIIQLDTAAKRAAGQNPAGLDKVRLGVLAASTVDHLLPAIRVAGLRHGLLIEAKGANYGQYRQELLDPGSSIHAFRPDAVLLSLVAREFVGAVPIDASAAEAARVVEAAVADLRGLWKQARDGLGATVIQQSFLNTEPPLFGGLDAAVPGAPARLIDRLNAALAEAAFEDGVLWLDVARASARDGLDAWYDGVRWLQAKMAIAMQAAPLYGELAARLIAAARGKSRKCLVLDLDNTLWGGVIGDDGLDGIIIGEGSGVGEAHLALQRYARQLRARGVILAVCSKNNHDIAEAAFRDHPEMLLRRGDFAAFVANWTDKATNLETIARELNIGLDSLVFVDDNPVERDQVRARLPMVAVPELPKDPAHYVRVVAEAGYFEAIAFTREDLARADQYAANLERAEMREAAGGMDGFLEQLAMAVEFGPVTSLNRARVTQLINKTNQFNTTTIRLTEAEVEAMVADPAALLLQFRLTDKFGDNGIVSVMTATLAAGILTLDSWVMSCRVFGRQLEEEAMNILVEAARARGARAIRADFLPTSKNAVVRELYQGLGFSPEAAPDLPEGASRWTLRLADHAPRPTRIARKELVND